MTCWVIKMESSSLAHVYCSTGVSYPSVSLGRVATKASARGNGLGHQLLQTALEQCQNLWPQQSIEIGAQEHLREFYARYGFVATSEIYLEDGIPHIDMKRA
ncbi:GNAT family N-acetyltransferase [Vibrio cholerae]